MINSDSRESVSMPITAYLKSKHGLESYKSKSQISDHPKPQKDYECKLSTINKKIESLKIPALQLATLESQVKSNNILTVSNSDEIKKSKKLIENLTNRLDSCSSEIDHLTHTTRLCKNDFDDLKRGTKRKWDEITQFADDVDAHFDSFLNQMTDLETSIHDLSIQLKEIQTNQKKLKRQWLKSAAVGASAAIAVVAGVILGPELI